MRVFILLGVMACGGQEAQPATASGAASSSAATSAQPAETASAPPVASVVPSATPAAPAFTKPLKEIVGTAKVIKLTWREKLDSNDAKTVTIQSAASVKGILDALGADQVPSDNAPAYMSTFTFRFEDATGNPLATVSLYASATMSDSNKKYGRIDVADGAHGGIAVTKYDDLQKKLKTLGVNLP